MHTFNINVFGPLNYHDHLQYNFQSFKSDVTWRIIHVDNMQMSADDPFSYPGSPPDSMWLARVTSCDHTSNCHLRKPMTPQSTFPECTPTLMLISTPVASRTSLEVQWAWHHPWSNLLFMLFSWRLPSRISEDTALRWTSITCIYCTLCSGDWILFHNPIKGWDLSGYGHNIII